jgi:predicted nucleic-acid-binding Zn-ribbon protein
MKSGRCSKCKSTNVRKQPHTGSDATMVGWRTVRFDRYVCVGCGFTELYVADRERLRLIEQKWPRASE